MTPNFAIFFSFEKGANFAKKFAKYTLGPIPGNFREKNAKKNGEICHKEFENGEKWPFSNEKRSKFSSEKWHF